MCYANSVLGARTNREGGPSALAAALTGFTPEYGLHLARQRQPGVLFDVPFKVEGTSSFGALGKAVGEQVEKMPGKPVPYLRGIQRASLEELKSFCASLATFGGLGLFHMQGITPEASQMPLPDNQIVLVEQQVRAAWESMVDEEAAGEGDFVSLGCPHLSLRELAHLADLLAGKTVKKSFGSHMPVRSSKWPTAWDIIVSSNRSGAVIAARYLLRVAPIRGRFQVMATDRPRRVLCVCQE